MEWYTAVAAVTVGVAWTFVRNPIVIALERMGVPNAGHGLLKLFVVTVCLAGAGIFARFGDWSYILFFLAPPTVIAFRAWLRHAMRVRVRRAGEPCEERRPS